MKFRFEGLNNIPQQNDPSLQQGFIVASKHQSFWDTFTLLLFFRYPSYVLKRELMLIPLFGWFAMKAEVVPVNRRKGSKAMELMTREAGKQLMQGRQVIIYPEGTRKAPFAQPEYKYGIAHMYKKLGSPVLPVALNSGLLWPRRSFLRYPGTITMKFLPMIEPGMELREFLQFLEDTVEQETDKLMLETENSP